MQDHTQTSAVRAEAPLVNPVDFRVVSRFDCVVIGSADHYFAVLAWPWQLSGREVAHVIGAPNHVSTELHWRRLKVVR